MNRIQYRDFDPDYDPTPGPFVVQAEYCSLLGRANLEDFVLAEPFKPFDISVHPAFIISWAGPPRRFRIFDPRAIGLSHNEVSLYDDYAAYCPLEEGHAAIVRFYFPANAIMEVQPAPLDTWPQYAGQWVMEL